MSIIIAYTVPTQWSLVMKRERERQTIFLMKQYAKGIANWERKHSSLPVSLEQLQEARDPRMLRGTGKWANPLNGQEDGWILVPPNAIEAVAGPGAVPPPPVSSRVGIGRGAEQPGAAGAPGTGPSKLNPALSPADYVGPFVAVRPNATGKSMIAFRGAEDYSEWVYTVADLKAERAMRQTMMSQRQQ